MARVLLLPQGPRLRSYLRGEVGELRVIHVGQDGASEVRGKVVEEPGVVHNGLAPRGNGSLGRGGRLSCPLKSLLL